MRLSKTLEIISLLVACIMLSLAYALNQSWFVAAAALGLGVLVWYVDKKNMWPWRNDLFLAGAIILSTIGSLIGFNLYLSVATIFSALIFWDISRFRLRMERATNIRKGDQIERKHLGLLGIALVIGGILVASTLTFQIQLSFAVALTLGVLLIISLGQIYRQLRG